MLIGLCGYAGSGKDAVAEILVRDHGFTRLAFADALKDIARRIGWNGEKDEAGRKLLQDLGVACRECIYSDIWVDAVRGKYIDMWGGDPESRVVITDVRFPNEIGMIWDYGGKLWRVDRPGVGPVNGHISESAWCDSEPDATIVNDGTLDDLAEAVRSAIGAPA
jgi:hypothetical protein